MAEVQGEDRNMLAVAGSMDPIALVKAMKKIGPIVICSVGPVTRSKSKLAYQNDP